MQEAGRQIRAYFPKRVFVFSRTVRGSDQQGLSFGQGERERERGVQQEWVVMMIFKKAQVISFNSTV